MSNSDIQVDVQSVSVRYPVFTSPGQRSLLSGTSFVKGATPMVDALQGINIALRPGDRIGLIGHNGAGKSTLLKLIGGLIVPSKGRVVVRGQRLSILNLFAGLEPDRSGLENIRFVCRLFGLEPSAIEAIVEDVVEFAELGDFMKMPVRTYSAGMALRLAFGIYTALPHDILIVDEVLAAGDSKFQAKAAVRMRGKIEEASILVMATHNEQALREFCNRGLWLHNGRVVCDGDPAECWRVYSG